MPVFIHACTRTHKHNSLIRTWTNKHWTHMLIAIFRGVHKHTHRHLGVSTSHRHKAFPNPLPWPIYGQERKSQLSPIYNRSMELEHCIHFVFLFEMTLSNIWAKWLFCQIGDICLTHTQTLVRTGHNLIILAPGSGWVGTTLPQRHLVFQKTQHRRWKYRSPEDAENDWWSTM